MSKTYRKSEEWVYISGGVRYTYDEYKKHQKTERVSCGPRYWLYPSHSWTMDRVFTDTGRDTKRWDKPPKWFKQMRRRIERAKIQTLIKQEKYDQIGRFKKDDAWRWT